MLNSQRLSTYNLHNVIAAAYDMRLGRKNKQVYFVLRSDFSLALLWLTPKIGCASGEKINKFILFSARIFRLHYFG